MFLILKLKLDGLQNSIMETFLFNSSLLIFQHETNLRNNIEKINSFLIENIIILSYEDF